MNLDGKWVVSFDEDNWSSAVDFDAFESKDELISFINNQGVEDFYNFYTNEKGEEPKDYIRYYVGRAEVFVPSVCAGKVIDYIGEQAYDETCGYTDDYLNNVTDEQEKELSDKLNIILHEWLDKHNLQPHFFNVVEIEEHFKAID